MQPCYAFPARADVVVHHKKPVPDQSKHSPAYACMKGSMRKDQCHLIHKNSNK